MEDRKSQMGVSPVGVRKPAQSPNAGWLKAGSCARTDQDMGAGI